MFDVPLSERSVLKWSGSFPYDEEPWNVGLIVGPSGSGKSTIAKHVFGSSPEFSWNGGAVIDDFSGAVGDVAGVCSAVGFNTIPAWLRPYSVLSNGERFRVDLARRLLECESPIVVDEFTSVVDRQVAQIGSHAVQKYVRAKGKKFVAVSCHYDILDWLQPDWVLEASTFSFTRRLLQRRPSVEVTVGRVPYSAWSLFKQFHYMSADLNSAARCYGAWVGDRLAAFCGVLHRPHAVAKNIKAISRVVTLPDWQGLGLAFVLTDAIGASCRSLGQRLRNYPAHPAYVRACDRSKNWALVKKPGTYGPTKGASSSVGDSWKAGSRPCAVFEYCGPAGPVLT